MILNFLKCFCNQTKFSSKRKNSIKTDNKFSKNTVKHKKLYNQCYVIELNLKYYIIKFKPFVYVFFRDQVSGIILKKII